MIYLQFQSEKWIIYQKTVYHIQSQQHNMDRAITGSMNKSTHKYIIAISYEKSYRVNNINLQMFTLDLRCVDHTH